MTSPASAGAESACGITVREDRIAGAEGMSGEIVVRRAEVLALRLGSAALTELPWVEGIAGALLVVLTVFLLATRNTLGVQGSRGSLAAVLVGSAAAGLLTRTFYRRPALIAELKSGDRRKLWMPGTAAERARLLAALKRNRWPLTA